MADILASVKSSVTSVYHIVTLFHECSCSVQCNISEIITFVLRPLSSNMADEKAGYVQNVTCEVFAPKM